MKSLSANFGIVVCGLATSVLAAIINVVASNILGFSLFSAALWFVIPVGAIAVGIAAASGYYFGALFFHKKPDRLLLVQMVAIAALAQFLIYYFEYIMMSVNGQKVSDYIAFGDYLDTYLTKSHYSFGQGATLRFDAGEAGSAGYWLAGLQFIGFLLGGFIVYFLLGEKPICAKCQSYLRSLGKKAKRFEDSDSFSPYYNELFTHPVDSKEFAELVRNENKVRRPVGGTISLKTTLYGCPSCKSQVFSENVSMYNGKEWEDIGLNRNVQIPDGTDLKTIFR